MEPPFEKMRVASGYARWSAPWRYAASLLHAAISYDRIRYYYCVMLLTAPLTAALAFSPAMAASAAGDFFQAS